MLGAYNCHDINCQPGRNVGSEPLRIEVLTSRRTDGGQAAAACHIRQLLQSSVDKVKERQAHIFQGACAAFPR